MLQLFLKIITFYCNLLIFILVTWAKFNNLNKKIMNQVFGTAVVFYGIYMIIKLISEHFLRR